MKEVFIKYNPYKLETEIKIDGNNVKENSALNVGEERLQEWLENLPQILVDECNSKEFKVVFHGTMLDYEDLLLVAKEAQQQDITIKCEHIPAKEVGDKEQAIDMLFTEIQNGPFDELRQPDVVRAFELAKSSDFEVNVVATMSAGKSTLINALLGQKLMPAKQEACTATITKIKDSISDTFRAIAYDKNGELLQAFSEVTLEVMNDLNSNPDVSMIQIEGDIPFVTPEEVSLVLVDTPGPNNSRDPEHKAATYRMLSESSKAVVLYVLNATQLGVQDDSNLLDHVAQSMSVGGKQSKDRFMFIVNKLDDYKGGEDSVTSAIEKVRKYLKDKGILNAHIFPAAALPALNIRTFGKDIDTNITMQEFRKLNQTQKEFITSVDKLNDVEMLHLEQYAPLTPSIRSEVTAQLCKAKEENDANGEALIHTGIIPIELAIRMYVQKYAKTAKVKNIVETFAKKLESAKSFENTKQEIAVNKGMQAKILSNIEAIKSKLKSGEEGKKFKAKIEAINYDKKISDISQGIINVAQKRISEQLSIIDSRLSRKDAESVCAVFDKFAQQLQAEVQVQLEDVVTENMRNNAEDLLTQYKNKIAGLSGELSDGGVAIDTFEIMGGDIGNLENTSKILSSLTKTESVAVGERQVKNYDKKWYKPWTWGESSYFSQTIYKDQEYIEGSSLAERFFAPLQKQLFDNSDAAVKYAKEQVKFIKLAFSKQFDELDVVLARKLEELELCTSDEKNVEVIIKKTEERLAWLEDIQRKAAEILEI